ncbi:transport and Golgi organization protein 1 homolog isoform X2 [Channa argus]|uniref:transport and Golgi organization protein 1 homolog isoform X2 n=1 Tax=Channa argus TaxID=215402 RepID=UPI003520B7EC
MAAKHFYPHGFVLLLFYFIAIAALDKRFSDFKRCTDPECSMLLCRGKAVKDFSGPDCRFLSFKKSETIYVYYKLSGRRADLWAGSVGNHFGYFPKDLLEVNHLYTDKELEVPAEETDFVCFDNGFDKFDNYNIDLLLGSSLEVNNNENKGLSEVPDDTSKETQLSAVDAADSEDPFELYENSEDLERKAPDVQSTVNAPERETQFELNDNSEDVGRNVPDDHSASLPKLDVTTEPPPAKVVESVRAATPDTVEQAAEDAKVYQENAFSENVVSERTETKDTPSVFEVEPVSEDRKKKYEEKEPVSLSEEVQIPELKTTLGTTFDAVTTDDEITNKVTPYEEEESKGVENHPEDDVDVKVEIPLLSFTKESVNTPASDTMKQQQIPPATNTDKHKTTDDKNMLTSNGDNDFPVVTGEEATGQDMSSEEEEEEEEEEKEEEENAATKNMSLEEAKKDVEVLTIQTPKESVNLDQAIHSPPDSSSVQADNKESGSDSEEPLFDQENERDGELILSRNDLNETLKPTHEPMKAQTESSVISGDPQDHVLDNSEAEKSKITHHPPTEKKEEKVSTDLEINEDNATEEKQEEEVSINSEISEDDPTEDKQEKEMSSNSEISEDDPTEDKQEKEMSSNSEIDDDDVTKDKEEKEVSTDHQINENNTNEGKEGVEVSSNSELNEVDANEGEEENEVSTDSQINENNANEGKEVVEMSSDSEINKVDDNEGEEEKEVSTDSQITENNANEGKEVVEVSSDSEINEVDDNEGEEEKEVSTDSQITENNANEGKEVVEVSSDSEINEVDDNEGEEEKEVSTDSQITENNANEGKEVVEVSSDSEINEVDANEDGEEKEVSINSQDNQNNSNEGEVVEVSSDSKINEDNANEDEEEEEEEVSDDLEINEGIAPEEKEMEEGSNNSEIGEDNADIQDIIVVVEHGEKLVKVLDKNKMLTSQASAIKESDKGQNLSTDKIQSNNFVNDEEKIVDARLPDDVHQSLLTDLESNNSQQKILVEEPETQKELHTEETEDKDDTEIEQDNTEERELLEDENALLLAQSNNKDSDKPSAEAETPEPEYSDSVMRLTLLRGHFTEKHMQRFQKLLGLNNLVKVEAMFSDMDTELQATRLSNSGTTQDIENALESILEASENTILDVVEKMLDNWASKHNYDHQTDTSSLDEESEILDDFQELAFSLRHKYSAASDSTPLATEKASDNNKDEHTLLVKEDIAHIAEEDNVDNVLETESDGNLTETGREERSADSKEEQKVLDEVDAVPDVSVEEDGGRFNKNKDNQPGFSDSDKMQKVPQATLENPLDIGLGVEEENSPSGSLDSIDQVSEIPDEEVGPFSAGIVYLNSILSVIKCKIEEWTIVMISLLPEEWKPGQNFFGCPWQAVVITALVGVATFTLFFWRTVLAIKKREYLVDEKRLREQIQALKKEKNDAVEKMSELHKQTEQLKENQKQSKETVSSTVKKMQDLESKVLEAEMRKEQMVDEKNTYAKLLEEERANSLQNVARIEKLEKTNEKLQLSRKKIQEALAKTTVLLDEAKIREDARNLHHKCLEKEYATVKEENKTLKVTIKQWEDKHKELSEEIKVYHKSQKALEDSVVLKDHNVEVLSELLADLEACDLQKGDTKVLANGEIASDKKTALKNRIKQMMDVSRVQTTLSVVEEERDRFMTKLLNEEKARKSLEEQHQELEHAIATIKSEKSHVENQFKMLQQKNEIMVEMYQQKENALQQRLTKEELERRSKENLLSEVGGKALEVQEQVKILRQRISEMEEQMKKTEEVYKEQIKEQENKTHSNWVNARNAERALNQEKLESSKLREKLAVLTSQLNERRAPLFRPNSGQLAGPRQGDSYGHSPVSGGVPSPPLMIEGPRRPPSAPVGRRIDPYGPRPPSDPHGRYPENKHIDMMGPRSSSPANMDASGPGSFLASPIRDSPGPMVQGPPPGPGPHDPLLPPGPHGRLPPPGLYRPTRPGLYHLPPGPHGPPPPNLPPPFHGPPLPANGHPVMPLSGPMGGEFGPRPTNGHAFNPRPGPGPLIDPRGPPPPHFRPPLPHHLGPMSPPTGVRRSIGPRPPIPPDMRFPGPRDHTSTLMDMAPGLPPHPADAYGQPPPDAHSGPGQDLHMKQEALQDSTRPAMVKP